MQRHSLYWKLARNSRSYMPEMFFNISIFKDFAKLTGKQLCQSFFPVILFKKRLRHRCFPVNFVKVILSNLFTEHHRTTTSKTGQNANKTSKISFYQ